MDHHHQYQHNDHDQYQHQMTSNSTIITTIPPRTTTIDDEKKMMTTTRSQEPRNCPRCNSSNTKFCYYNNYSLAQPRYLCKSCRRYWTEGGSLRNVPVGGCSRKNKKIQLLLPNSSTSTKNLPDLNPPFVFTSSSNPSKVHENNNDLSLSFSSLMQDKQGHFMEQVGTEGQNSLFSAPVGMIQFRRDYDHDDHNNNNTNLGFSLDRNEKEIGNYGNFVFNGNHDDEHHHNHERQDDGNKKREGGSSNELWNGIILGGDHSGGPTW